MPCTKYEPLLAAKLFGDLNDDEQARLEAHVAICASCRRQLATFERILSGMGEPARPEMPLHFWDGYWHRLIERMEKEPAPALSFWEKVRETFSAKWSWGWQVAAAASLLVLGMVIGQYFSTKDAPVEVAITQPSPANIPAHNASARTAQLLERSKILLIGIVNDDFNAARSSDLARQRKVSRALLQETRALQTALSGSPDRRVQQLLQQLEFVLLQIANLEIEHDLSSVELVREGIDREGLLLKINIEELVRAAEKQAPGTRLRKGVL
ncbi:MAG: anti-sigma factor family protein [bacterium]